MSLIETVRHGALAEIRLARPPVNALNPEVCDALRSACHAAVENGAQGLLLSGGPSVFSAGLDLVHLAKLADDRAALYAAWEAFFTAAQALAACPVPVAAAVGGHAPAGGCVLALCCDYRVMAASPDATRPYRIGLNETRVGLVVPEGIQALFARIVGARQAERLLVAGALLDSDQALRVGLVDQVVPPEQTVAAARAWLEELSQLPREAMLRTRAIAREDLIAALHPERIELGRFIEAWYEPATQEALRAALARLGK